MPASWTKAFTINRENQPVESRVGFCIFLLKKHRI
nr:MAG TPA: hypothetical protein [Caudoviricetes sp.]